MQVQDINWNKAFENNDVIEFELVLFRETIRLDMFRNHIGEIVIKKSIFETQKVLATPIDVRLEPEEVAIKFLEGIGKREIVLTRSLGKEYGELQELLFLKETQGEVFEVTTKIDKITNSLIERGIKEESIPRS